MVVGPVGPDGSLPLPWLAAPLARALAHQRSHATLVHGPSGVGQFPFAMALAQAWLCEAGPPARPCGRCAGCRLVQQRSHPDLHLLLPDALRESLGWAADSEAAGEGRKARPSREIRVDAVRAAIDWGQQTSSRGGAKVLLIHPAQALNTVAANALLKTLEEPPGALRLLLTVDDPESLLPTLRSRCQRLPLTGPAPADALSWLQAQGVDGAAVLLRAAGGQPLEAQAMASDGVTAALWQALPRLVRGGDAGALAGWPLPRLIGSLQKLCHDLLLAAAGAAPRYFEPPQLPPGARLPALLAWADALKRAARHDEHPWNAGLLVEALVLQGRAAWAPAASAPLHRLDTLAAR